MRTELPESDSIVQVAVSAIALRESLRVYQQRAVTGGGRLNEGAQRVLRKLEEVAHATGMRRAYVKNGQRVTMWDLLSDADLLRRGYVRAQKRACSVFSDEALKHDRVTCWTSQHDPVAELWIGEALAA